MRNGKTSFYRLTVMALVDRMVGGQGRLPTIWFVAATLLIPIGLSGCVTPQLGSTAPVSVSISVPSAVPDGEQAVDALGIEVFVPTGLALDPPCPDNSISRPASGLTYTIGCTALAAPAVGIDTAENVIGSASPPRLTTHCLSHPMLDGEAGCVVQDPIQNADSIDLAAIWPRHDVGIQAHVAPDQAAWAVHVFDSARWVPVDRHGCAASRSPVGLPEASATAASGILPGDIASLSICWYSRHRLVASAVVDNASRIGAIGHPTGVTNGPGITLVAPYTPQPTAPLCTDLDRTEGVVLLAHAAGRTDAISSAQLADCRGHHQWTDGRISVPSGEPLASALRAATGFLLVYGYMAVLG